MIIDDGSVDGTEDLVATWIDQGQVEIRYIRKSNGGMHTAHNVAYEIIETELNVCVDSDDFMPDGALERIIEFWRTNARPNWAGLIGLDAFKDGRIVGTPFPVGMMECKYSELKPKHGVKGDKKFVYRTDVVRNYAPYPTFEGERFVPLGYKYLMIDHDYDLGVMHEVLCVVEYLPDGSTRNIFRQYVRNPKGFAYERQMRMKYSYTFRERFKNAIHYVSCSIFTRNTAFISESTSKLMTAAAIPFGICLNIFVRLAVLRRGRRNA